MENTEKNIIEQLKLGDEQSYKYIYDNHYVYLCHIANGYVADPYMAESIVGDVIFRLWEVHEELDISSSLRSYLARSVRNRCINYLEQSHERFEIPMSNLSLDNTTWEDRHLLSDEYPLGILLERELEGKIAEAIHRLPNECGVVFRKKRFEKKKYEEISQELGISVNTVKYHLKKALALLQEDLGKYLISLFLLFFEIK